MKNHILVTLGEPCTQDVECIIPKAKCIEGVCKCPSIFDRRSIRCETSE